MFLFHCHKRYICRAHYNQFWIIFCLYRGSNLKFCIERAFTVATRHLDLDLTLLNPKSNISWSPRSPLPDPGLILPLRNFHIQDDSGCQPGTCTPGKIRGPGHTGKHSLTPNSKFVSEPNILLHAYCLNTSLSLLY